jgi:hypothetical protein
MLKTTASRVEVPMKFHPTVAVLVASLTALAALTACTAPQGPTISPSGPVTTSVPDANPRGDIPDNQAFVAAAGPSGSYRLEVPEGWAETRTGSSISYTDKLNSITVEETPAAVAPTVRSATANDVPQLQKTTPNMAPGDVTEFSLPGGQGIRIRYQADSGPDPVTQKVRRQAVERYLFWKNGTVAALTLAGPQDADNADPWAKVSGSFRWLR